MSHTGRLCVPVVGTQRQQSAILNWKVEEKKKIKQHSQNCSFIFLNLCVEMVNLLSSDLCSVHFIPPTRPIKLWSRKMWRNTWVCRFPENNSRQRFRSQAAPASLTVLPFHLSGEMDDVLDNIRSVYERGGVYGHVSLLVSDQLFDALTSGLFT